VVWTAVLGGYALAAQGLQNDFDRMAFGNLVQCLVPLAANAGLLINAASPNWRRNAFWMLLGLGCTLWLGGQLLWTYWEVFLRQPVPNPFVGDVVFFLHTVPLIAALALRPHARRPDANLRFGYLDFSLLLLWWIYLYLFVVIPWQYVVEPADVSRYGPSYNALYTTENLVFVAGLALLYWQASGEWRKIYAHLFGAAALYTLGSSVINISIDLGRYKTGSLMDLPLVGSFLWFGTAGYVAYRLAPTSDPALAETPGRLESPWPARLAIGAILSMPALAMWTLMRDDLPPQVEHFRIQVTLIAIVVFTGLLFLRQYLVDRERVRLLHASQDAVENLKRLQTQFVQSEKLASLGQLAAGAAHEINNPLTAILGYLDLLGEERPLSDRARTMVEKIREQARRTKTLVNNLLSFAKQAPADKALLDINPIVANAVQLRTLDLRNKNIRINLHAEQVLPAVRCDANQMLQVFFNIISNAVDAMDETGGGALTVRTMREKSSVVIEFSDSGPGVKEPQFVFDPFYTTKPVGKGTGLGLSICYGIVTEHGGTISCYNRHQGGATFRIELPTATAALPKTSGAQPTRSGAP
jgi:signal transduction histidine kinase